MKRRAFTPQEDETIRANVGVGLYPLARLLDRSTASTWSRLKLLGLELPSPQSHGLRKHGPPLPAPIIKVDDTAFVAALNALGGYPYRRIMPDGGYVLVTHDGRPHPLQKSSVSPRRNCGA
jgi:hypothetical protein